MTVSFSRSHPRLLRPPLAGPRGRKEAPCLDRVSASDGMLRGWKGARDTFRFRTRPIRILILRNALAAVLVLGLPLVSAVTARAQPARPCTVQRVIDGDTFVCRDDERVRLLLVDTPEMGDEPLGRLAREFVRTVIPPDTRVRLELDVQERDRYGRLLAYVRLPDDRLLNRVVAREGYAQVMVVPPNVDRAEEMRAAVAAARREGAGLWGREGFGGDGPSHSSSAPSRAKNSQSVRSSSTRALK